MIPQRTPPKRYPFNRTFLYDFTFPPTTVTFGSRHHIRPRYPPWTQFFFGWRFPIILFTMKSSLETVPFRRSEGNITIHSATERNQDAAPYSTAPSMTLSLFVYWVVPVGLLALVSRFAVDTSVPVIDVPKTRPITLNLNQQGQFQKDLNVKKKMMKEARRENVEKAAAPTAMPPQPGIDISQMPVSYREIVQRIQKRRRKIPIRSLHSMQTTTTAPSSRTKSTPSPSPSSASLSSRQNPRGPTSDPQRIEYHKKIAEIRKKYLSNPDDLFTAIQFADTLRLYDVQFHDGGTFEHEAIEVYQRIVEMAEKNRQELLDAGKPTNISVAASITRVSDEVTLEYQDKSADGLLCAVLTAQGKVLYMANWFERATESYTKCLEIDPFYLDARNSRGSTLIILGRYKEAATDFMTVIQHDTSRFFTDAFTGLARVLATKEDALPEGWTGVIEILDDLVPQFENILQQQPQARGALAGILNRFHHVLFTYHDSKTKNYSEAWDHLTKAYRHKMSLLAPWREGIERQKAQQTMSIFKEGFWQPNLGSTTQVPIFVVGFVRSGSTLLERVLDAHPMIVGTGENSVFNGRLDEIRNKIVSVSVSSEANTLGEVTRQLAEDVVDGMKRRWEVLDANTEKSDDEAREDPKRFVDKMLTNYYNIGFIHMLYPNALILHVAREPMDSLFSAYKHEFPPGTLDYTSEFKSLAELYVAYRELMDHWDRVLPGRVTHVRYEDMVHDMPSVAQAIIRATGLPWDESVLDFHKKKHAVNTLSTTQVRKGIYKDSLLSWTKYEHQLLPLRDLIGDRFTYELKTNLPGYVASNSFAQ